jgi:hypothetical protein
MTPNSWPSEATLARLWEGQRFPAGALLTRRGLPVRVLHPGLPGRGAGPDFRGALLAAPSGGTVRGDVELHVRASEFRAHGHDTDPRYAGLVLHVVFDDDGEDDTALPGGGSAPVVALGDWVRRRSEELAGWLASPRLWREPCWDALDRLGAARAAAVLEELGDRRFAEREAALGGLIARRGPAEALGRALLSALGHGAARPVFDHVADVLDWPRLAAELAGGAGVPQTERLVAAEALLLGAAGLLPEDGPALHPHERALLARRPAEGPGAPAPPPRPSGLRPAGHPARRLAGLAALLVRHGPDPALGEALEAKPAALTAAWTVPARGYWRERLAPGLAGRGRPGALIGRARATELLVNAVLPWAAARAETGGRPEEAGRARAAFGRLPRPAPYGRLAFLERNQAREDGGLALNARRQQGLLALYKAECSQGGCGRCALS